MKNRFVSWSELQPRLVVTGVLLAGSLLAAAEPDRSFDADWRFCRGDAPGAEQPAFADGTWRKLDVPHDWSIEDLPPETNSVPALVLTPGTWRFAKGDNLEWRTPVFADNTWEEVKLPAYWNDHSGYTNEACYGWYRCHVTIPADWRGRDFRLNVGVVDDADETFFNGERIGGVGGMPPHYDGSQQPWTKPRVYRVPASLVREEDNVVAVRVYNQGAKGGLCGAVFEPVGPFSPDSPGGPATGHVLGGIGWYRKQFTLAAADFGKQVSIRFDGVYMDADVWLNGKHLGNHPYGYTAFAFDLTPHLNPPGTANTLAVRVRNLGKNSRWYSGSGIYRHVWLTVTDPVHVALWGFQVTTPNVSRENATLAVKVNLENAGEKPAEVQARVCIYNSKGRRVAEGKAQTTVSAKGGATLPLNLALKSPALWSPASPNLYRAEVEVNAAGRVVDRTASTFGIRSLAWDSARGFRLNGEVIKMRGGCLHHDNGPLGSAAIDRAEERRVELMKQNGFNAIRTSHNPPSPAFLDACDRLGVLVIDEAFDCWEKGKNPEDYHRFFKDWWERDLAAMVLRDINHPSVVLWSIGNEIPERAEPAGLELGKQLVAAVKRLDPTRPVTQAICSFWDHPGWQWPKTAPAFALLDVGGYNYTEGEYKTDHEKFPERLMVGTESYPLAAWRSWSKVEQFPWVLGDFVWTGMDYLGESGIGHTRLDNEASGFSRPFPWFNAWCGDIDICGFKKPQSFYRDVLWGRSALEVLVHAPIPAGRLEKVSDWGWPDELPSWTWPVENGRKLQVAVYSSCEAVRLELNGREIATRTITPDAALTARFEVPYAAGELRAVGLTGGKVVAAKTLRTAGPARRLRLVPDRETIRADRNDLSYVTVEIVDAKGSLVPAASVPVRFSVSGAGELAAVGSGSPNDAASWRGPVRNMFQGHGLAILRPTGSSGKIRLAAESGDLAPATVTIRTK